MLRFIANNPDWKQSPNQVTKPGMEKAVMGPYYPRGYCTTKAEFEAEGPKEMIHGREAIRYNQAGGVYEH